MQKPPWLKVRFADNESTARIRSINFHSVCQSARCPNRSECWAQGTATFMVMGDLCTRGCRFCAIRRETNPPPLDAEEPGRLAKAVSELGLRYVVVTSVSRDDIADGGAGHIAECITAVRKLMPELIIEVLVPDFNADRDAIQKVADAKPDVVSHNVETVERLTPEVRDRRAGYGQSLETLRLFRELSGAITKSGIMVGLGESEAEVKQAMADLRERGVDILTVGQYLQPTKAHLPVKEYVPPERFAAYERMGYECGFRYVASGPFVRSSYRAAEPFLKGILERQY